MRDDDDDDQLPSAEDQLLEQWDFLDSMLDRQAAGLRTGEQDADEPDQVRPASTMEAPAHAGLIIAGLREQIEELEGECAALGAELSLRARRLLEAGRVHEEAMAQLTARVEKQRGQLRLLRARHRKTVARARTLRELNRELKQLVPPQPRRRTVAVEAELVEVEVEASPS